jgi:hypothetical protein
MREFNELENTNAYLVNELIQSASSKRIMTENNRRLENMLIKTIQDLQECRGYLVEMQQQVGELATVALARVKKS